MTRAAFHAELDDLRRAVLALGAQVQSAVEASMLALRHADDDGAQRIIDGDAEINRTRYALEEQVIALIASQSPVAGDLRRLVSALAILNDLERIGDHAVGIARISQRMNPEPAPRPITYLPSMADRALAMLGDAMRAFEHDDTALAHHVCIADDDIDRLQERIYQDTFASMAQDATLTERSTYLLWTAHNLERIGDRCTNIGERVIYTVTGSIDDLNV